MIFRIWFTSQATGSDETTIECDTLDQAKVSAAKMIGQELYHNDRLIGIVENAYIVDANGNII